MTIPAVIVVVSLHIHNSLEVFRQRTIETEPPLLGHDPQPHSAEPTRVAGDLGAAVRQAIHCLNIEVRFITAFTILPSMSHTLAIQCTEYMSRHAGNSLSPHLYDIFCERRQLPLEYDESPLV